MARYAISRRGAEQLMNLVRSLLGSAKEIESAESALWNALKKESKDFGAFEEDMREITREIRRPLSTYREAFFMAARRLSAQADEILDILNLTGPASAGYVPFSATGSPPPSNAAQFQSYADSVLSGELSPLVSFALYQNVSRETDKTLVGITTSNGLVITGKSDHFLARLIGSTEARDGADIGAALLALTSPEACVKPVRTREDGMRSQEFQYAGVEVTVNPDSGNLIQINPLK